MNKFKLASLAACLILALAIFSGLITQATAVAQSGEQTSLPEANIELETKYPVLSGTADTVFEFEVKINYTGGDKPREFDLSAKGPVGWVAFIQQSSYESKEISAIRLEPTGYAESVLVKAAAPPWELPDPGEYIIVLEVEEADSGEPKNSLELKVKITARYDFSVETTTGRLNIKGKAGEESYLPITIINTGTATLDKITFSSSKPEDWRITFKPDKIESLDSGDKREVEVTVKPPAKTIAGDYMTTLKFDGNPKPSTDLPELDIRVAVSTPTKWGWIGVGIVIAVIAGLAVTFTRLGRR